MKMYYLHHAKTNELIKIKSNRDLTDVDMSEIFRPAIKHYWVEDKNSTRHLSTHHPSIECHEDEKEFIFIKLTAKAVT